MTRKIPTITLSVNSLNNNIFGVDKVTDSVAYLPGDVLKKNDVAVLCRSPNWKVTIVRRK